MPLLENKKISTKKKRSQWSPFFFTKNTLKNRKKKLPKKKLVFTKSALFCTFCVFCVHASARPTHSLLFCAQHFQKTPKNTLKWHKNAKSDPTSVLFFRFFKKKNKNAFGTTCTEKNMQFFFFIKTPNFFSSQKHLKNRKKKLTFSNEIRFQSSIYVHKKKLKKKFFFIFF